ncbi:hypothetical protein [Carnobacterium maltaromaticum]|uniref:hypothetical protein n=1 Tax=Carnobacterium maltaromaticum TaxID=2751 RepID=UPI00295E8BC5|nr:hypothetical protein [Carnobacterium maltaromaticum]
MDFNLMVSFILVFIVIITLSISILSKIYYRNEQRKRSISSERIDYERRMIEHEIFKRQEELKQINKNNIETNVNRLILEGQSNYMNKIDSIEIDKELVLYLTPFSSYGASDDVSDVVKKSVESLGLKFVRSDNEFSENIFMHIMELISKANIIIANIDGRNPNVFYELGICHTLNKNTIILSTMGEEVPFDIHDKRIVFHENSSMLKKELIKSLGKMLIKG